MRKYSCIWMLLCCLAYGGMTSCSGKKSDADEQDKGVSTVLPDSKNEVTVQILKRCDFHHELVSNGKVSARGQADLRFETNEVIAHVYVKNGDRVRKGQKLAELDKFRLEQKLSQSEDALLKAELEENAPNKRLPDAKILIVEDNASIREMLANIFSPFYEVLTAADGEEGLALVNSEMPTIVVSDVVMPKMSGTELCKLIKSDFNTCHIPVVLLTARTAIEQNIEGLRIGADDYITKPFNTNLLISRCNNLVNSRILLQEKFSKQPQAFAQMLATNPIDKDILDRAMTIIENHLDDTEFNVNVFAREMAMARTNLFTKLKAITGQTPNDFILTIRLKKGAFMLRNNPELNITEISDKIGFSSSRYFSKCFKDIYHVSPLAYRKGESSDSSENSDIHEEA